MLLILISSVADREKDPIKNLAPKIITHKIYRILKFKNKIYKFLSTNIFFNSAIALAGLSPFGHVFVQFIMVWHLYNLKGSSSSPNDKHLTKLQDPNTYLRSTNNLDKMCYSLHTSRIRINHQVSFCLL